MKAPPNRGSKQVLVRLPDDLAERLASIVPSRKRSRFLVDLLRKELDRESQALSEAARRLTELEAQDKHLAKEQQLWSGASLVNEVDDFDHDEFERQLREAQSGQ